MKVRCASIVDKEVMSVRYALRYSCRSSEIEGCHYVIDHVILLCAGGADHPFNMQWQTIAGAKGREEARECAALRRYKVNHHASMPYHCGL